MGGAFVTLIASRWVGSEGVATWVIGSALAVEVALLLILLWVMIEVLRSKEV